MVTVVKTTVVVAGVVGLLALGVGTALYGMFTDLASAYVDPSDQTLVALGKKVYANNCAACHGAQLEGQPDWRTRQANGRLPAPPHDETGHTWHHPDAVLIAITKNGLVPGVTAPPGYVSDMPAYGKLLSDHDILAVLAYIKSSWPSKALAAQKEITQQTPQ
ncbi:c-type cytochrome [Eoetvoesiella caeni]|uniref:Cbb3-type cytochrome c oxidase subunit III n=1 Tax=Eoetvoesiella caeni TaxID=645616 RepID=A0A366H156_9BURK|nr:cytochrome c [Eoetvoesiella caeni]MCI2810895.1 cytochrome c [Eoetvoesiella caeni]NYT56806.1 cytochrome c [Eoetvoesiella caeni]RBP35604.1 cbb3-type cytochrome c oxidase subunit III [Eoetvoesiella caeni]